MIEVTDEMVRRIQCCFSPAIVQKGYVSKIQGVVVADYNDVKDVIHSIIELHEASKPKPEPVGYFKVQPWGYEECNHNDEGSFPLYKAPPTPTREPLSEDEMPVGRVMVNGVLLSPDCTTAFILGVRFAEQKHGIGATND